MVKDSDYVNSPAANAALQNSMITDNGSGPANAPNAADVPPPAEVSPDATNATLEGLAALNPAPISTPATATGVKPLTYGGVAQATAEQTAAASAGAQQETSGQVDQANQLGALEDARAATTKKQLSDEQALGKTADETYKRSHGQLLDLATKIGQTKVDPDHWWNNKDTGGKIAAGIGLLFGGLGQGGMNWGSHGQGHASNTAIDAIDNAIKQDIDSQHENIQNQWKEYAAKNDLADNETNYNKYVIIRKHAEWDTAMKVVDAQARAVIEKTQDPILKGQLAQKLAEFQTPIIKAEGQWGQYNASQNAASNAKLVEELKHQRDRAEKAQDTEIEHGLKLEQTQAEGQKEAAVFAAGAPEREYLATRQSLLAERGKVDQQFIQHGSDWWWGSRDAAEKARDVLDVKIKALDDAHAKTMKSQDTTKGPKSGKDLP